MSPKFRILIGSLSLSMLGVACRNGDKSATKSNSPSAYACSYSKDGAVTLCTQYQTLSGSTLTSIQSECELRSTEGYSWSFAACPPSTVGTCTLAATAQKPAPSVQYYYGPTFSSAGTAEGMCGAQQGTFK